MLVSEQGDLALEPGYVYMIPCGMKFGFYGTPSVTKLFFHISLTFDGENDVFGEHSFFSKLPRSVEYINEMKTRYLRSSKEDTFFLRSEIASTVCEFILRNGNKKTNRKPYSKCVSDAISYVRKHVRADLTVKEVCQGIHCSAGTLTVAFKNEIGQCVSAFIEERVMSEAQVRLLYSDLSIGEISEALGYSDQFYFSRRFKKYFSVPPSQYRKRSDR